MLQRSVDPTPHSAIPKVVGILAIVFASLGLLVVATPLGLLDDIEVFTRTVGPLDDYLTWLTINAILSILLFGLHLAGGILAVHYSARAPKWMTLYGVSAIVLIVVDIVVSVITFPEGPSSSRMCAVGFDELVGARLALDAVALPWPIVVLALMNRRSAKQSCKS
jgi:hypothetical protein